MYSGRVLAPILVWALILGSLTMPAVAQEGECEEGEVWDEETRSCVEENGPEGDPQVVDQWIECRDDGKYEIREYDDGSREEERVGECDEWIMDSWCDGEERVETWTDDAGSEWQERYWDPNCANEDDTSWKVESWCDGSYRVEEWENETGHRWQDRYHDAGCEGEEGEQYDEQHEDQWEDPYGCSQGEWWDHYLARCISEEASHLREAFWECTEEGNRRIAQEQKEQDLRAREARQERRSLEEEAMQHERAGRYDEAQRIWEELRRMDWEEQRHWYEMEKQMADAQEECIREYSDKARAIGAEYLVDEFEEHRFHVQPEPEPMRAEPYPGEHGGSMECAPPPTHEPRDARHDDRFNGGDFDERYDDDRYSDERYEEDRYPDDRYPDDRYPDDRYPDERYEEGRYPDERHDQRKGPGGGPHGSGPGEHCGEGGPMMDEGFGLPPEAQEAVREAMAWCEERMWEIDSERFQSETFEEAQALEDRVREVERECREKMEAIFREYGHGRGEDFDEHFGSFTMTESGSEVEVIGRNLLFTGKPEQSLIKDFSCQGVPVLDSVRPYFTIEDVWPTSDHKLAFFDHYIETGRDPDPSRMGEHERDAFMVVHDDPHCTIKITPEKAHSADQAEVKLVFPSIYSCAPQEDHLVCTDEEGTEVLVRVHGEAPVRVDDRTLIISGSATLRLADGTGDFDALGKYSKDERFDGSAAVSFKEDKLVAQSVTVGDLQMDVTESDDGKGLKVTLDKASHVGSYVVLTLDAVESCSVELTGWDVTDDNRERLELRKASNLVDALDTDYDGDHAKYYAVKDEHGCQLIITNSHYSVKEFVVHPVESGGLMNLVPGPGFVLTALGALVGLAVVRRRVRE